MNETLFDVDSQVSLAELMARIRDQVRQQRGAPADSPEDPVPPGSTEPPVAPTGADGPDRPTQADLNESLVRSLGAVTQHFQSLQAQLGLVEEWLRDETERAAELDQETSQRLDRIERQVARLAARLDDLAVRREIAGGGPPVRRRDRRSADREAAPRRGWIVDRPRYGSRFGPIH